MNEDVIEGKILDGGVIQISTGKISPAFHSSAQEFIDGVWKDAGGDMTITRLPRTDQDLDNKPESIRFDFFHTTPENADAHPPLVSSLQSLETCFSLTALERYPHALLLCASAIESAIRAKLQLPMEDKTKFWQLLEDVRSHSHNLRLFSDRNLEAFTKARNRIVHYGFSPKDDEESVRLLLQTALPFLKKCYQEFFDFYLDWRDVRPGVANAEELTQSEAGKVGLSPLTADQLHVAFEVFSKAKEFRGLSLKYCLSTFAQYIGYTLRMRHRISDSEHPDAHFGTFSLGIARERMEEAVQAIWQIPLDACIEFDCTVCGGPKTLVARCDERSMKNSIVSLQAAMCVKCGLSIPKGRLFLADAFLKNQLSARKDEILQKYGKKELTT